MVRPRFTVIRGGKYPDHIILGTVVRVVPLSERARLQAEVMVFEEDTQLLMTVDEIIDHQDLHPLRLLAETLKSGRHAPGSVVVNGRNWYAVVLDVDHQPLCCQAWVEEAYRQVSEKLGLDDIEVAAIHLLGCIHGGLSVEKGLRILLDFAAAGCFQRLRKLLLVVPDRELATVRQLVRAAPP